MLNEKEIRSRLADYLAGSVLLPEFHDWLIGHSWNSHLSGTESAQALLGSIEVALAEFTSGDLSEESLRDEMRYALFGVRASTETAHSTGTSEAILIHRRASRWVTRVPRQAMSLGYWWPRGVQIRLIT